MVAAQVAALPVGRIGIMVRAHLGFPPRDFHPGLRGGESKLNLLAVANPKSPAAELIAQARAGNRAARHRQFPVKILVAENDLFTLSIGALSLDSTPNCGTERAYGGQGHQTRLHKIAALHRYSP